MELVDLSELRLRLGQAEFRSGLAGNRPDQFPGLTFAFSAERGAVVRD